MTFVDTILCLCLAMQIHGTDKAVRMTAKRCLPGLEGEDRRLVSKFINSKHPMKTVKAFVVSIPEHILKLGADEPGMSPVPFAKKQLPLPVKPELKNDHYNM